jgi:tRNA (cytidine/uridine-2'-O-)-methyltransferase
MSCFYSAPPRLCGCLTFIRPMFHIVLVEPEIPPNTGNIGRLCLATGAELHLVRPLGFDIDDRTLKRAGLDYWAEVKVTLWDSFAALQAAQPATARWFFLTTKSTRAYWDAAFQPGDFLVFGRETKGLPEPLLTANADRCLTIPMQPQTRSLNLATAVGIVLYEAQRQVALRRGMP